MSGKGSKPRPIAVDQETYASNWDAIFLPRTSRAATADAEDASRRCDKTPAAQVPRLMDSPKVLLRGADERCRQNLSNGAECAGDVSDARMTVYLMGSGVTGSASVSTTEGSRSSLDSPAIYVNADTLEQVTEDWWPELTNGIAISDR